MCYGILTNLVLNLMYWLKVPELSLKERFVFALSPVNTSNPRVLGALLEFATVYGRYESWSP